MSEKFKVFEIVAEQDGLGAIEEFSWDLSPVVNPEDTSHLNDNGLPKIGTSVSPGMVLIGKIGKSPAHATDRKPTDLEIHGLDFDDFKDQFGHLWVDRSAYVPKGVFGEVESAELRPNSDGKLAAIVKVRLRPVETTNATNI